MMTELQFGFTARKGGQKALLMFSVVIDYFKDRGRKVYMYVAGLDVAKALDSVNHYGIFIKLINMHIPFYTENLCQLVW